MSTPSPARPRHLLVAAAVLLVVVVAGFGALNLVDEFVEARLDRTSVLEARGPQLTVRSEPGGDIVVAPSTDGKVHVRVRAEYGLVKPDLVEESTAAGIRIAASCPGLTVGCTVDYELEVPPALGVQASTTAGSVTVREMSGPVRAEVDSGDVTVSGLTGSVHLRTLSGRISGSELSGTTISGQTGSGDIRISTVAPPQAVTAETGSGDVEIALPGTTAYRVEIDTGTGEEAVTVPRDAAAQRYVRVETGSGDATVRAS